MHKLFIATVAAVAVFSTAAPLARDDVYQDVFIVEDIGTVVPFKEVTLAAQLPGRVKFIAGVEGEAFDSGTTLIALDEDELLAKRGAAFAQLAAADATMRNAGVQYSRELWSPQSSSGPGGMGIPNLFDQMFTRPAEGFLGQRDRGAERSADLYASSTRMEQARSAMLQAQSATFDDYPDPVAVRVAQVFPMADMQSYTIKVKFDIPQGVSQPGMYARVRIPDTSGPVKSQLPIIPSTAIRYRGSLPVVYIQNANGEPELRMIRQGKRLENGMTMVLSGIAPGDRVYPNPGPDLMARSRAQ